MEPVLAINDGVTDTGTEAAARIQDALDEIEYVTGSIAPEFFASVT